MLLNQCLAISLSFSNNESKAEPSQIIGGHNELCRQQKKKTTTRRTTNQINQSTAFSLFEQLVLENSKFGGNEKEPTSNTTNKIAQDSKNNLKTLGQVFKRIEFAGFVVPSWLLLSGTYDDLHCIKSNWASGQLRAPDGLRVETIGNIRSVNVDYFGESQQQQRRPTGVHEMDLTSCCLNQTPSRLTSGESPAELESRVLYSLKCLTGARRQTERISLDNLAEFIGNKWAHQPNLATLESVERTSRALSQMGRLQMGKIHGESGWFVQLPANTNLELDSTATVTTTTTATSPGATISGRNSVSSTRSAKSKSTTLDSGLGSGACTGQQTTWDSLTTSGSGSPVACDGAAQESSASSELQLPSAQVAVVEKAPQSGNSILSRLRVARSTSRRRLHLDDATVETSRQVADGEESSLASTNKQQKRRGFSLTRSLSFRQPPNLVSNKNISTEHKQDGSLDTKQSHLDTTNNNMPGRPSRQCTTTAVVASTASTSTNKQNANLSSLFRSKSMRVVSSSSFGRKVKQHAANLDCDNDYDDDHDELDVGIQRRRWRRLERDDISTSRPRMLSSGRLRSGDEQLQLDSNNNNKQQQATIDYLTHATTQRHKRTFSMRRNSILAFGKDELGGGAGRIAMFLRRLFSMKRGESGARQRSPTQQQPQTANDDCFVECSQTDQYNDQQQRSRGRSVHHLVDIHHHHHSSPKQWLDENELPGDANNNCNNCNTTLNKCLPEIQKETVASDRRRWTRRVRHHELSSTGAEDDEDDGALSLSPSQNSLIEILDCSHSLEESKRDLVQEEARSSGATRRQAKTWNLIERSESSLSRQSNASCSTNKSTVSQQLRRHLDEAYKRHRNCTSKRERDFIDSINVLRQASRHASLQNSRSSSKNRRHKHSATATSHHHRQTVKSSSSQTNSTRQSTNSTSDADDSNSSRMDSLVGALESESSSGASLTDGAESARLPSDEIGHQQRQGRMYANDEADNQSHLSRVRQDANEDELLATVGGPDLNKTFDDQPASIGTIINNDDYLLTNSKQQPVGLHIGTSPVASMCDCCCPLVSSSNQASKMHPSNTNGDGGLQSTASALCSQFNCCQTLVDHQHHHHQALAALAQQPLPACCLALQPLTQTNLFGPSLDPLLSSSQAADHLNHYHHQLQQHQLNQLALPATNNVEKSNNSLCCPIWRSMIYSYCQQQQQVAAAAAALPYNVIAAAAAAAGQLPATVLDPATAAYLGYNQDVINQDHPIHQQQPNSHASTNQLADNRSSSTSFSSTQLSTNQQQQHNTTIDLKIEIGADFKKLAAKAARRDHNLAPRSISTRLRQSARNQPVSSSSDDTADSLDGGHSGEGQSYDEPTTTTTDESLQMELDDNDDDERASRKEKLRSRSWRQQSAANNKTTARQELVTSDITTSCEDDDHSLPSSSSAQDHWQELSRV